MGLQLAAPWLTFMPGQPLISASSRFLSALLPERSRPLKNGDRSDLEPPLQSMLKELGLVFAEERLCGKRRQTRGFSCVG